MLAIHNERISFSSVQNKPDYPDFLDIQVKSFQDFFQLETKPEERSNEGLYNTFKENFPITDTRNQFVLEFLDYFVDPPRYSIQECIERGLTYSVPLKARLKLYCTDPEHEDFETIVQDVYLGTIPYMTPSGTFVINGAERVVVSQLHRSPGVFFGQSFHANGTKLYSARVIPFKGSWIEFATDINSVMYAYIDRKKKLPVTTLFRAIGFERDKDILEIFDLAEEVKVSKTGLKKFLGRKLAARVLNTWYEDFVDEDTGEVVSIERNEIVLDRDTVLEKDHIEEILETGSKTILLHKEENLTGDYAIIYNTLQKDPTNSEKEAVEHIYRQLRNAEPPDEETARGIIDKLFFSDQRYNLGEVGRYRMNKKLGLDISMDSKVLTKLDIITIIKYLIELVNSKAEVDDIDHLSNRRVRTVGEQLSQQFGVGLARMARTIRERMNVRDNEVFTPIDLINAKTLSSVINSFFGTNQLSQFMDQTNPLAELTNKRRLSALGPGGLSRERAGFEVRDVHYTHYGRLCPIETPEGPNIGLISSLCVHAKINEMGFIETPYRNVKDGNVSDEVEYLSAEQEDETVIAQANAPLTKDSKFEKDLIFSRKRDGNYALATPDEVGYMDVAPNQITSVAASMIPFIEHDDANRALMGSNMQRQAVPLLRPEAPVVGTGLEKRAAVDSRAMIIAEGDGVISYVSADEIRVRYDRDEKEQLAFFDGGEKSYPLRKYERTNQDTIANQTPIVKQGDRITKGQALADGCATQGGELALGRNIFVAFMPWRGYNFEDAIVISERVVRDDIYTSIHVSEYEMQVRDTKRGEEELTREIPNVSEEATRNLDERGIIRIGAKVHPGDIMVGKITPKGETDPTPEEKLLRAIFGDKAGDVKDASLKAKPGVSGTVIETNLFSRKREENYSRKQEKELVEKENEKFSGKLADLTQDWVDRMYKLLKDEKCPGVVTRQGTELVKKGTKYTKKLLEEMDPSNLSLLLTWTEDEKINNLVITLCRNYRLKRREFETDLKRRKCQIQVGDELPPGIVQKAKILIAKKRKMQVGDKMAGRHGNKGVIAKVVPIEDMPFTEDGQPVDIVLNPLGVPSRMNLGQIYETILGWAGKKLGVNFATPIFDGATEGDVVDKLNEAGLPKDGRVYLYDGRTGQRFKQKTTVGYIYMLKLNHLVEDKMHARSIGPYSLITQQPLGGKAQFGGQRLGEMEVWALYAYGAANILQEMLTVKSDDVKGRSKIYEAIVKGDNLPEGGTPESFNVLVREMQGLGLEVTLD